MPPSFERLNKVMAYSLGISPEELLRSFVRAIPADIDEICALRRRGFGDHLVNDSNKMRWRYFSRNADQSDMLVLRLQGRIVAAVGVEPIQVQLQDVLTAGVRCADIVVDPEMMSKGLGAWMNLYIQNHYSIVMAMGSNANSGSMVRKLFTPMPIRSYLKFPIRSAGYLQQKNVAGAVSQLLHVPLDVVLFFRRKFYDLRSRATGLRAGLVEGFSPIADFVAADRAAQKPNTVVRDVEFMRWRFAANPVSTFLPVGLFARNELIGFAVLKIGDSAIAAPEWFLMDWQIAREWDGIPARQFLMNRCVDIAAAQGAGFLDVLLSDEQSKAAAIQAGFSLRCTEDGFFLWADESVSSDIFAKDHWFLSYSDTDEVT